MNRIIILSVVMLLAGCEKPLIDRVQPQVASHRSERPPVDTNLTMRKIKSIPVTDQGRSYQVELYESGDRTKSNFIVVLREGEVMRDIFMRRGTAPTALTPGPQRGVDSLVALTYTVGAYRTKFAEYFRISAAGLLPLDNGIITSNVQCILPSRPKIVAFNKEAAGYTQSEYTIEGRTVTLGNKTPIDYWQLPEVKKLCADYAYK